MKNNDVSNFLALGCLAALGFLMFSESRSSSSVLRIGRASARPATRRANHLRLVASNGKVMPSLTLVSSRNH